MLQNNCNEIIAEYETERVRRLEAEQEMMANRLQILEQVCVNENIRNNAMAQGVKVELEAGDGVDPLAFVQVKMEPPSKKKKYACPHCGNELCRNDVLQKHIQIKHPETLDEPPIETSAPRIQCPTCPATFGRKWLLTKHIARKHGDSNETHPCIYGCGQVFSTQFNAKDHGYRCRLKPSTSKQ